METFCEDESAGCHFELNVETGRKDDRIFLSSICIAWALIFQQYLSTDVLISIAETRRPTENGGNPSPTACCGDEQHRFHFALEPEGTISKAYSQFGDQLGHTEILPNGRRMSEYRLELAFTPTALREIDKVRQNVGLVQLTCMASQTGAQMMVKIDRDFTCAVQRARMVRQFRYGLDQLLKVTGSDLNFRAVPMIPPEDIQDLRQWNGNVPLPELLCFGQAVEEQALQHPNALAVSAWDGDLSYKQLDTVSSSLATFLVDKGITPETLVPVCFEKSQYAIIALVAVAKAGGAFVLLDPGQPLQRLKSIIKQVGARICLVSAAQHRQWTPSAMMEGLDLVEVHGPLLDSLPEGRMSKDSGPAPDNACYVGFTSGSTGEPKGVVIEHRNVMTFVRDIRQHQRLQCEPVQSRVLQFASHAFDASIGEIIPALSSGACLCIPSEESRDNDLAEAMNSLDVNAAILTPSVLKTLSSSQVPRLRTLHVVGEALSANLVREWADKVRMNNAYGPSECSVSCMSNTCLSSSTDHNNVGFADSCVAWIVDPHNSDVLVPIGAIGELLVEGPLVGRGYLGDAKKTEASFIKDPSWLAHFRPGSGHRLYKTGDLVKYAPDGSLIYVGRKDNQVKVRGQRLELTEVEVHICKSHADVQDAVADVITPVDSQGGPILVAFVTLKSTEAQYNDYFRSVIEQIEDDLTSKVPRHMVPSAFMPLSHVPLSPVSGKTHRKALRELASSKTIAQLQGAFRRDSACPRLSPQATVLQQFWCKVLGLKDENLADTDSFFRLGGDSILATQLSKVAKLGGWDLSVAGIFKHPTLSAMARVLLPTAADPSQEVPTYQTNASSETNCDTTSTNTSSYTGEVGVLARVERASDVQEDAVTQALLPFRGGVLYVMIDLSGPLDIRKLQEAFCRLTHWHEALRTVFFLQDNQLCQGVLSDYDPDFEMNFRGTSARREDTDLQELHQSDLRDLQPLGVPMLKFMLYKYADNDHQLIMRICHANIDGFSMNRLQTDLRDAYMGVDPVRPPSFFEYLKKAKSHNVEASYAYWHSLLAGSVMTEIVSRTVPDFIHPTNLTLSQSIRASAVQIGDIDITPATLVKAAWALTLAHLTAQHDVIFGHLVSGRNVPIPGGEDVVGPCIADVPVRVQFQPSWTVNDLLLSVQDQYYNGIPHETLGFPEIVRKCTNWPRWTRLSSYLQFQNLEVEPTFRLSDDVGCKLQHWEANVDAADIYIMVTPRGALVDVEFSFSNEVVPESLAQDALGRLCKYITTLSRTDSNVQELLMQGSDEDLQLPIPNDHAESVDETAFSDHACEEVQHLHGEILHAWSQVLPPDCISKGSISVDESFFDRGGDFPRLVYLAELLKSRGLQLPIQDLVYRPTVKSQLAFLLQQRRLSESHRDPTMPQFRPNAQC